MVMIESLKQSLKTEIPNRKETEDAFMQQGERDTENMSNELTLQYLN